MARRSFIVGNIVGIALATAVATTAMAQTGSIPSGGLTFDEIIAWVKDQGYEAKISKDGAGNKMIATSANGTPFSVYPMDCKDDRCGSVQFAANWPTNGKISAGRVADWNREKRWARAYLSSKTLWVEADFDISPGGTYELLNDEFDTWKSVMTAVKTYFDIK